MKKRRGITAVLLLTVLAIGGMRLYDAATQTAVETVETVSVTRQTVKETVICSGTVTATEGVEVYASVPCVVESVAVKVGDRVEAGDVLLTVDRAATLAMALDAGVSSAQSVMASAALPQTVTAPSAGTVSAVSAVSGELVSPQMPCAVLSEANSLGIAVTVHERLLPFVAVGQEVAVSGVAFEKPLYKGVLGEMATTARSRVNGGTGETVVDATVYLADGEADESLLIGLSAKAAVTVATHENVLLVPYDCIAQDDSGNEYVYRVQNGAAHRAAVKVQKELPEGAVVSSGVQEGDTLVRTPENLSGDTVAVKTEETL